MEILDLKICRLHVLMKDSNSAFIVIAVIMNLVYAATLPLRTSLCSQTALGLSAVATLC